MKEKRRPRSIQKKKKGGNNDHTGEEKDDRGKKKRGKGGGVCFCIENPILCGKKGGGSQKKPWAGKKGSSKVLPSERKGSEPLGFEEEKKKTVPHYLRKEGGLRRVRRKKGRKWALGRVDLSTSLRVNLKKKTSPP